MFFRLTAVDSRLEVVNCVCVKTLDIGVGHALAKIGELERQFCFWDGYAEVIVCRIAGIGMLLDGSEIAATSTYVCATSTLLSYGSCKVPSAVGQPT